MSGLNLTDDWRVRQDRIEADPELDRIEISGKSYRVVNFNSFGLLIESDQPLEERIENANFFSNNSLVSELILTKTRSFQDKNNGQLYEAFSVMGEPLKVEKIVALRKVAKIIEESDIFSEDLIKIPENFRIQTFEVRTRLLDLKNRIEKIEPNPFELYKTEIDEYENVICKEIAIYIRDGVAQAFEKMGYLLGAMTKEQKELSLKFFRDQVGSIIYQAPYPKRALEKPRGYAGDFDMMISTYRLENRGENLFAKCIHRYFVEEQAPAAVRNRANFLEKQIIEVIEKNKKAKILSVACGPAIEVENLMINSSNLLSQGAVFHFLDQDEEALKTAQRALVSLRNRNNLNMELTFHHQAIKDVISNGLGDLKFDLIYSAGLFDYLTAPVAQFAATKLFEHLEPGGTMIIGNFSKDNPNQYGMVLTMDWKLIYRDKNDMENMVKHLPGKYTVINEDLGINLFTVFKKVD